jgi:hypothetical protein
VVWRARWRRSRPRTSLSGAADLTIAADRSIVRPESCGLASAVEAQPRPMSVLLRSGCWRSLPPCSGAAPAPPATDQTKKEFPKKKSAAAQSSAGDLAAYIATLK